MSELVAKTSAAVAVDDSLTTLIDWTNIELFSGFTIFVSNAGGGSADDITDVQIDTSDDAGVTSSLDQHADTPAVPITTGDSKVDTFTETAKYVRVRAICGAENDTTAEAWLLADSSQARICTLADVKDRLGITKTDYDVLINRLIVGAESVFEAYIHRPLIVNAADVPEYFTALGSFLQLNRYPVISITSLKEALDYDFDSADALVADTDYRILNIGTNGVLKKIYSSWFPADDCIQVVYRGGYTSAGQTPGEGETALPADIREAAIEQVSFIYKRRDDIGLASVSAEGGSISKFAPLDLLPLVKKILDRYKKPSL